MERRRTSVFALALVLLLVGAAVVYHAWSARAFASPVALDDTLSVWTIPLDIRIYDDIPSEVVDVPGIIQSVREVMLKQPGVLSDYSCNVKFVARHVATFNDGFDGIVRSSHDFDAIFAQTQPEPVARRDRQFEAQLGSKIRQVRVVWGFDWCGNGINGGIAGCSDQNGYRVAVNPVSASRGGPLWAHEIGHTKDLQHRDIGGAVMAPLVSRESKELNGDECGKYRRDER